MAERTIVDLIEDWQTGFFVVLGAALAGFAVVAIVVRVTGAGSAGGTAGFFVRAVTAFLAYSYLRYGR